MTKIKPFKKRLKEPVQNAIKKTGYELLRQNPQIRDGAAAPFMFDDFLDFWFASIDPKNFYFIQIGANDGKMQDPMYKMIVKNGLSGCLVEPQPAVFEDLKKNYTGQDQLDFANVAIAPKPGEMTLYTYDSKLQFPDVDMNLSGFASFDRASAAGGFERYGKQLGLEGSVEDYLIELPVEAVTFPQLLERNKVEALDYLLIDAEGLDYEILKMIDFTKVTPRIIRFEHCCLSRTDRIAACELLKSKGYQCYAEGIDTMAIKASA
ncbi:MAG: FkbM family methyltransferase [Micavibrio sp.]|nr:FkbM family methyltransferase [Micavibrio sp.]